jgi:hypothetical protein
MGTQEATMMNTRYATDMWGDKEGRGKKGRGVQAYTLHKMTEASESRGKPPKVQA